MPGYCDPPVEHRFKKGQSGNPKGGPRGPRRKRLQRRVKFLDETLTCTIAGKRFKGQRREALVRVAVAIATAGRPNLGLQQLLLRLKAQADEMQSHILRDEPLYIIQTLPAPPTFVSCVEDAADVAGFGAKAYHNQKSARVLLENWVVEEALERLGDRRLSRDQQMEVLAAVRYPKKMKWPDWWEPDLRARGKGWRAPQNAEHGQPENKQPAVIRVGFMEHWARKERARLLREEIEYERYYLALPPEDQEMFRKPYSRPGRPSRDGGWNPVPDNLEDHSEEDLTTPD